MWRFILGIGDGPSDDSLELHDITRYIVDQNGLNMPPADERSGTRTIELRVHVIGTDPNSVFNARTEIQRKIGPQSREGYGPHRQTAGVVLSMNLATDEWAYADVIGGTVTIPPDGLSALNSNVFVGVIVRLTCRRYFRGERVVNVLTQANVTSGTQLYLPSVAGTAPAIARMIVTDTSTNGEVINRVRVGVQGLSSGQYSNDVTFTNALTAVAGVETDGDGTDTHGSTYSTVTAQAEWQRVASLASPSVRTSGLYDAYLRWRDHASIVGTPTGLMAAAGAIGIVQASGRAGESVTSLTVPWLRPTTPGNLLVLMVSSGNVTVTPPAGWTLAQSAGTTRKASIYYKANASTESGDQVITLSGSTNIVARLVEYSGIAASTPLDEAPTGTTGSGAGTASTPTTGVTDQANELALAFWVSTGGYLSPSGFGSDWQYRGGGSPGTLRTQWADRVLTSAATYSVSMTAGSGESWTALLVTFKGATTAAPDVAAGTYQVRVTAITADGESLASFPASITLEAAGAINLRWDAPTVGTVTGYRVYLNGGSGWSYWDTGDTATNYVITTLASPTGTTDPPVSSSLRSQVRALLGVGSGSVLRPTAARESQLGNGEWEVTYLDSVHLPPDAALEDDEERDWTAVIQVRNDALTPDVDLDAIILRPHNACAIDAEYVDSNGVHLNLDTVHTWTLDTRRDERVSVVLSASSVDVAGAQASGSFLLWPGDNSILILLDSIGGVSDLENVSATVRIDYTPRWDWLPGQDWG